MKKPIMYKLTTYIPTDYLEPVKQALFDAGAGQIGNYQYCCWQVLGTGQFMPLAGNQAPQGANTGNNPPAQNPQQNPAMAMPKPGAVDDDIPF